MKQKIIIVLVIINIFYCSNNIFSAPGARGIAINEKTKQCGGYWVGDEFIEYVLPKGWQPYFIGYRYFITTSLGTYIFNENAYDPYKESNENAWRECARSFGLSFVTNDEFDPQLISYLNKNLKADKSRDYCCEKRNLAERVNFLVLDPKRKKATLIFCYCLGYDTTERLDNGYEIYPAPQNTIASINTPVGECQNITCEDCCRKLGYDYVGEVGTKKKIRD